MNDIIHDCIAIVATLTLTITKAMSCQTIHLRPTVAASVRSAQRAPRRMPTATRMVSLSIRRPSDEIGRTSNQTLVEDASKRARALASGAVSKRVSEMGVALMSQLF